MTRIADIADKLADAEEHIGVARRAAGTALDLLAANGLRVDGMRGVLAKIEDADDAIGRMLEAL